MANKIAQAVNGQAVGDTYNGDANLLPWYKVHGYVYDDTATADQADNTDVAATSDPTLAVNREDPLQHGQAYSDSFQWGLDAALAARVRFVYAPLGADYAPDAIPAAGGKVFRISGDNFTGATGVTVGGTAGTVFSVVDDNTVQFTAPAKAAGSYDVVVTKAAGNGTIVSGVKYV
jgi:hypothetical protein